MHYVWAVHLPPPVSERLRVACYGHGSSKLHSVVVIQRRSPASSAPEVETIRCQPGAQQGLDPGVEGWCCAGCSSSSASPVRADPQPQHCVDPGGRRCQSHVLATSSS